MKKSKFCKENYDITSEKFDIKAIIDLMKTAKFPVIINNPFLNCNRICAYQQETVRNIVDYLKKDNHVLKVIIFGSSTTHFYQPSKSDLDLYIEVEDGYKISQKDFFKNVKVKNDCDFLTSYLVNKESDFYKKEILEKGVVVYVRK